jgi:hypothetical protein
MKLTSIAFAALLLATIAAPGAAAPKGAPRACPAGQVRTRGACVAACPTGEATFPKPDACECPAGFGKILTGDGGGQCRRLVCRTGVPVDAKLCECPANTAMKPAGNGKARCVAEAPKAAAKTEPSKARAN